MNTNSQANRSDVHRRRLQAQLRGEIKFETALPCPSGHHIRYTSNARCAQCQIDLVLRRRAERAMRHEPRH